MFNSLKEWSKLFIQNLKIKFKSFVQSLDNFLIIKNGYSVWKHLVPFSIAALLLLTFSMPEKNLLINLVTLLKKPGLIWFPALVLTSICATVYALSIKNQIRKAYLRSDGDLRRTIGTTLFYIVICSLMAFVVLISIPEHDETFGDIWACLLLTVLSLSGIGWTGPNSWVEGIGVKSPDYKEGRRAAKKITDLLEKVRIEEVGSKVKDVKDFLEATRTLYCNIDDNLELEPDWEKEKLYGTATALRKIVDIVTKEFLLPGKRVENFSAACRFEKKEQYSSFIKELKSLTNDWPEWDYVAPGERRS